MDYSDCSVCVFDQAEEQLKLTKNIWKEELIKTDPNNEYLAMAITIDEGKRAVIIKRYKLFNKRRSL